MISKTIKAIEKAFGIGAQESAGPILRICAKAVAGAVLGITLAGTALA